jgi:hypothetical protein
MGRDAPHHHPSHAERHSSRPAIHLQIAGHEQLHPDRLRQRIQVADGCVDAGQ